MPLEADFKGALVAAGVHDKIVTFLEQPNHMLTDHASFANFLVNRAEVQTNILDQVGDEALKSDAGQRGLLIRIWREAESFETLRLERKAKGVGPDDLEDPLPDGNHRLDIEKFKSAGVQWAPALSELLCEPLYGRIRREVQRAKAHTVIPLERVRSAAEVPRTAVGKTLGMAPGIDLKVHASSLPPGPRPGGIRDHYLLVWLVQLLFLGGWAVLGRALEKDGTPFISFATCMEYVRFIREKVTPLQGPFPPLPRCIRCEFETRSLWAASMSKGKTLEEAVVECAAQQSAIWLWTTESDNCNSALETLPQDLPTLPPSSTWQPKPTRSRTPRRRGGEGSASGADGITTRSGKRICQAYNTSPQGCVEGLQCPHGDLHICNFVDTNGRLCGAMGHRRCVHHAKANKGSKGGGKEVVKRELQEPRDQHRGGKGDRPRQDQRGDRR